LTKPFKLLNKHIMEQQNQNSALLIMDMQVAVLQMLPDHADLITHTAQAIAHARSRKIPVMYVVVGFRAGAPELSPNNKGLAANKERFAGINPEEFVKIEPSIAPKSGEIVVTKRRVSAFSGSDLEVVLRAQRIEHIVLGGIATSGVVLSTVREAADRDYRISVLSDCCGDRDEEVQQVLINKVFPRQADVLTVDEWKKG